MDFYKISYDNKFNDVEYSNLTDWSRIKCPSDPGHRRAGLRLGNMKINIKNKINSDFLNTFLSEWIITERVANIFKKSNITGYKLINVEVCNAKLSYKLWELVITGNGGEAKKDSGIYLKYELRIVV